MADAPAASRPFTHDEDSECAACIECPGCGGMDGSPIKNPVLLREGGAVLMSCADCDGDAVLCPDYVPSPEYAASRSADPEVSK